jgi:hypothetical protein
MFDDLKQQNTQASAVPQNQNVPPQAPPSMAPAQPMVDMFDAVDPVAQGAQVRTSAVQSGKIKPVSNTTYVPGQQSAPVDPLMFTEPAGNKLNKIIIILVVVLLVLALGAGAYYLIVVKGKIATPTNDNQNTNQVANTNVNANVDTNTNTNQVDTTDSDSDGLTDEEEALYTTNALLADTDGDTLSDREEVKTYKTDPLTMDTDVDGLNDGDEVNIWNSDPLKLDSDGDSYPDGSEVKNGYSPIGPGKLATSTPVVVIDNPENTTVTLAMSWGMKLLRPITQCYQSSPTASLSDYALGADICNPKVNQNWPARPDSYSKVCVLDKIIQDNTWLIGLQSNSPDTLSSVICSQVGCQRASTIDYPGGKVCP